MKRLVKCVTEDLPSRHSNVISFARRREEAPQRRIKPMPEAERLRALERENATLKQTAADYKRDIDHLRAMLGKMGD